MASSVDDSHPATTEQLDDFMGTNSLPHLNHPRFKQGAIVLIPRATVKQTSVYLYILGFVFLRTRQRVTHVQGEELLPLFVGRRNWLRRVKHQQSIRRRTRKIFPIREQKTAQLCAQTFRTKVYAISPALKSWRNWQWGRGGLLTAALVASHRPIRCKPLGSRLAPVRR